MPTLSTRVSPRPPLPNYYHSCYETIVVALQQHRIKLTTKFATYNCLFYLGTEGAQEKQPGRFDLIVLDPPAFAKNKASLEGAARGYKEINLRAIKMLPPGGILVTCSCSYHMTPDLFRAVVADAALDARRRLRLLAERTQGLDHPILVGYDESHYLKCNIYEVV